MALFKNKDTDKKRKGENVIGKIIYGFLLFAPLLSILFTSLYTVFNKNAYESYYGETINNYENQQLNVSNMQNGNTYYFANELIPISQGSYSVFEINVTNVYRDGQLVNDCNKLFYYTGTDYIIVALRNGQTNITQLNLSSVVTSLKFDYINASENETITNLINPYFYEIVYNKYSYLDNAFEYGMYKTEQSNIYNWSKSTGTYTVLQNVCTGIGITNTFVPMLMAYWLLISIIYFLFDIALILIWAVHDKIHALKDAI